jgi:uncharacterized protein YggE
MSTEITVRGSFSAFQPPERGTVHASISYEGSEMEPAYDWVARDLEAVKNSVAALQDGDDGPVTWWSAEQLRTWSNRPWNQDGEQLPLVHHASVGIKVKFRDFSALSRWVGEHIGNLDGFRVSHVEWALTSKRRDELFLNVRTQAVRDAAARAQQYADALGLGKVSPVAIADAGMLGVGLRPEDGDGIGYLRAGLVGSAGGVDVELLPEDIEVSTAIDARFVVEVA